MSDHSVQCAIGTKSTEMTICDESIEPEDGRDHESRYFIITFMVAPIENQGTKSTMLNRVGMKLTLPYSMDTRHWENNQTEWYVDVLMDSWHEERAAHRSRHYGEHERSQR